MAESRWEQKIALTERQKELIIALTQRRTELIRTLNCLERVVRLSGEGKAAMPASDDEWARKALTAASGLLRSVEDALVRLRAGDYGICRECGEPVTAPYLQSLPWAALCAECAQRAEKKDAPPPRTRSFSAS